MLKNDIFEENNWFKGFAFHADFIQTRKIYLALCSLANSVKLRTQKTQNEKITGSLRVAYRRVKK